MASNLPTIVNAIKAFSLNYNGKLAKVKDGLSIPNTAEIADLPMRIISATGTSGGQVRRLSEPARAASSVCMTSSASGLNASL